MKYLLSLSTLFFFTLMLTAQSGSLSIGAEIGWHETQYRFSNNKSAGLTGGLNLNVQLAERWWLETGLNYYEGRGDRILDGDAIIAINLRHLSISLPLKFGFNVIDATKVKLSVTSGLYVGYEAVREIYYSVPISFNADDIPYQNGFGIGATAGARLSYQLNRVGIYLQPEYLYGRLSGGDKANSLDPRYLQRRRQSFGAKIGVLMGI